MAKNYSTWGWAGSGYGERIYLEVWHSRTDTTGNYSVFGYKIYNNSHNSYGTTGNISWRISDNWSNSRVNGSLGEKETTTYYQNMPYTSGTFTISHSSDGTLKDVHFSLHINRDRGNITSARVNVTVANIPTIPRHSGVTIPSSFVLGNSFKATFHREDSSFYHTASVRYGSEVLWVESIETEATIMIDRNKLLDRVPNANSTTLTFFYTTKNRSGTVIGASTKTITCHLNAPNPTIGNVTHSEHVDLVKQIGSYVQSKTRLKVAITGASPGRGASIRSYRITVDGQVLNASNGVTQTISKAGNIPIVATVTDSRGKSVSKTVTVNVLSYEPPKISSLKVFRANSAGDEDDYGAYVKFEIGYRIINLNAKNTKKLRIKVGSHENDISLDSYDRVYTTLLSNFDVNETYTYVIELIDLFGKTVSTAIIPTGAVTMLWGRDSISVGTAKMMGSGTLNTRGQMYQNDGKKVADFNAMPTRAGIVDFNDFWKHGVWLFTSNRDVQASINKPCNNAGRLEVYTLDDYTDNDKDKAWMEVWQNYTDMYANEYTRHMSTGADGVQRWRDWVRKLTSGDVSDYIEDSGTTGGIYWEKWHSGKLVQEGIVDIPANVNLYEKNYPIKFVEDPRVLVSGWYTGGSSAQQVNITYTPNANVNKFLCYRRLNGSVPDISSSASFSAKGRWK